MQMTHCEMDFLLIDCRVAHYNCVIVEINCRDVAMTIPAATAIALPPWKPADLPTFRAAYSDRTAALMAFLANFAYDSRVAKRGQLPVPTELDSLGFTQITGFHNQLTDGWAYIAESDPIIVLAFRGTKSAENWGTNLHAQLIHPAHTDGALRLHSGFYEAFEKLSDGKKGIIKKLDELRSSPGNRAPIYITGHSLGGALAQIATAVLGSDDIAACYTFGSPRVGNYVFDAWVKPPSYRLINYADIVPQVPFPLPPLFPYRHSGDPRYMPDQVTGSPYRFQPSPLQRVAQYAKGLVQLIKARSILGIADHSMIEYCSKLNKIADDRAKAQ
jgi:triacylglycerol lipase